MSLAPYVRPPGRITEIEHALAFRAVSAAYVAIKATVLSWNSSALCNIKEDRWRELLVKLPVDDAAIVEMAKCAAEDLAVSRKFKPWQPQTATDRVMGKITKIIDDGEGVCVRASVAMSDGHKGLVLSIDWCQEPEAPR